MESHHKLKLLKLIKCTYKKLQILHVTMTKNDPFFKYDLSLIKANGQNS